MLDTPLKEAGDFPASSLSEALPLYCNVLDEILYANMRGAIARGHELLYPQAPHGRMALIVGGGPSARKDIEEIKARKAAGADIFALNGAGLWLQSHGIVPDALIVLDARAHNVRFVEGVDQSTILLLASQCDASLFEAGKRHRVIAWHPSMNGNSGIVENRPTVLIGGSTTVGMRALRVVHVLGFREVHLYGYDSSYELSFGAHAYPQPENDGDALREVEVDGELFYAPAWMIRQADDFRMIATQLIAEEMSLHVHGSGLLPTIAREMEKVDRPANAACYDMGRAPPSFDFMVWLVNAEMDRRRRGAPAPLMVAFREGPNEGFRPGDLKQQQSEKQRILENVMRPALALIGAVESDKAADGHRYHYRYKSIVEASRRGEQLPEFTAPLADRMAVARWLAINCVNNPLVITLREAKYWPVRNSDLNAWTQFAQRRKREGHHVVFVRDTDFAGEPIPGFLTYPRAAVDLATRAALYAAAKCNLTVATGPVTLLQFGKLPFIEFKLPFGDERLDSDDWWLMFTGTTRGSDHVFPWHGPHQLTVWQRDTVEFIEEAWRRWLQAQGD